jgi:hypothetical protein
MRADDNLVPIGISAADSLRVSKTRAVECRQMSIGPTSRIPGHNPP